MEDLKKEEKRDLYHKISSYLGQNCFNMMRIQDEMTPIEEELGKQFKKETRELLDKLSTLNGKLRDIYIENNDDEYLILNSCKGE